MRKLHLISLVSGLLLAGFMGTAQAGEKPKCLDLAKLMAPLDKIRVDGQKDQDIVDHTVSVEVKTTDGKLPNPDLFRRIYLEVAPIASENYWKDATSKFNGFHDDILTMAVKQDGCKSISLPMMDKEWKIKKFTPTSLTLMLPDPKNADGGTLVETTITKTSDQSFELVRKYSVQSAQICPGLSFNQSATVTVTEERVWGKDAVTRTRQDDKLQEQILSAIHIPHLSPKCIEISTVNGFKRVESPAGDGSSGAPAGGAPTTSGSATPG